MRPSPRRHNLARLRLFLGLSQKEMADLAGCSVHTIQSVELGRGRLALSEELARRISTATGVHFRWLWENNLKADIVRAPDGSPFTKSEFEHVQAQKKIGSSEFMQFMIEDYAASFYGQIRALLSSSVRRDLAEVAVWKIAKFLEDCRSQFGHDKKLIPEEKQFGLRADDSPYLKHRQVEAGIKLFKEYDKEREKIIGQGLAQLAKPKNRRPLRVSVDFTPDQNLRVMKAGATRRQKIHKKKGKKTATR